MVKKRGPLAPFFLWPQCQNVRTDVDLLYYFTGGSEYDYKVIVGTVF
jgi:hypothetical protein